MLRFLSIRTQLLAVIVLVGLVPAQAMAMRCGTHIITKGDSQTKVLRYCGEPTQARSRYITRGGGRSDFEVRHRLQTDDSIARGSRYHYFVSEEILVEEWVFNLGPNRLMRQITFENGFVVEVETLEYGYNE